MAEEDRTTRPKPSKAERRRRIDICESLLIDCASVTEIRRYFAEKEKLHLGRRTVERYAEIAEQRILKASEPIREVEMKKAKRRLERCFARAMTGSKKNVFAAIAAQKSINGLLGLNAPKFSPDDLTLEQLAHQVALERKSIDRLLNGPVGVSEEISQLLNLYQSFGEDPAELVRSMARWVESASKQTST
jgi:hypothetical protein